MGILVEDFFELLRIEVSRNKALQSYYKFQDIDSSHFYFRKAYFCQRLQYIINNIESKNDLIWDCGCGFGTTAIFLSLNGYKVYGSTLEFYYDQIKDRLDYWGEFGNLSELSFDYENIFDNNIAPKTYNIIIAQDTLHHLEPLDDAISIFNRVLKPQGKLIAIEENGNNIIQNIKLFKQRGNKRIITIYDERLKKDILLGNENIRNLKQWKSAFLRHDLIVDNNTVAFIRLFMPWSFSKEKYTSLLKKELNIWKKNTILKNLFYFGLNFIVKK